MLPSKETGVGSLAFLDNSHHFSCVSPMQSLHTQCFELVETYSDPQRWYKGYFKVDTLKKIQKAMLPEFPLSDESRTFQKCSCPLFSFRGIFQPIHLSWRQTANRTSQTSPWKSQSPSPTPHPLLNLVNTPLFSELLTPEQLPGVHVNKLALFLLICSQLLCSFPTSGPKFFSFLFSFFHSILPYIIHLLIVFIVCHFLLGS